MTQKLRTKFQMLLRFTGFSAQTKPIPLSCVTLHAELVMRHCRIELFCTRKTSRGHRSNLKKITNRATYENFCNKGFCNLKKMGTQGSW